MGFGIATVPEGNHFTDPHHVVGLVVIIMTVLQPILAFVRCHPPYVPKAKEGAEKDGALIDPPPPFRNWLDIFAVCKSSAVEKKIIVQLVLRLTWEVVHKVVGYAALVLAVVTCFLGIVKLGEDPAVTPAEVTAYTAVLAVAVGVAGTLTAVKVILNFTLWRTWPSPSTCFCEPSATCMAKANPVGGKCAKTLGWTLWTLAGAKKADSDQKAAAAMLSPLGPGSDQGHAGFFTPASRCDAPVGGITAREDGVNVNPGHVTGRSFVRADHEGVEIEMQERQRGGQHRMSLTPLTPASRPTDEEVHTEASESEYEEAGEEEVAPAGWTKHLTDDGEHVYYENDFTGDTTWYMPTEPARNEAQDDGL
jgi:hypothetical protein